MTRRRIACVLLALMLAGAPGAGAQTPAAPRVVHPGSAVVIDGQDTPVTDAKAARGTVAVAASRTAPLFTVVYVAPAGLATGDDTVEYTVGGQKRTVPVSVEIASLDFSQGELYAKSFRALFILFILAVLVENGLALLFRWRPFLSTFDTRSVNPVVSFALSLLFVSMFHLDITTGLMNIYSGENNPQGWPGTLLTAMIVAGGSGAVNRLFRAFGLRLPLAEAAETPRPPPGKAWIAVALAPSTRAVGAVDVLIGPPGTPTAAGTIDSVAPGLSRLVSLFVRGRRRFPRSGGHAVPLGEQCVVRLHGLDRNGQALDAQWGPYVLAEGAVVDLDLDLKA